MIGWAATQFCLLLSGPLLVRVVGVEGRGEFALVSAVTLIWAQCGLLGLPAALMYFASSDESSAWSLLSSLRRSVTAQCTVAALGAATTVHVIGRASDGLTHPRTETILASGGAVVVMLALSVQSGLQGEHRFRPVAVLQPLAGLLYALLLTGLLVAAWAPSDALPVALGGFLTSWAVLGLIGALLLRASSRTLPSSRRETGEVLAFGRRASVATAAPTDQLGVDQLLVGAVLGHLALGVYVIGASFQSVTLLPFLALAGYVGPRIARTPPHLRVREATRWIAASAGVGLLVCSLLVVAADPVIPLAFGAAAHEAVPSARLLAAAGLLLGVRRLASVVLQACGAPGRSTAAELASFATMVVGVLVLGWRFGVLGACGGVIAAGVVSSASQFLSLRRLAHPETSGAGRPRSGAAAPRDSRQSGAH